MFADRPFSSVICRLYSRLTDKGEPVLKAVTNFTHKLSDLLAGILCILQSILGPHNAESKPLSQYLVLMRFTVDLLTFNVSAISSLSRLSSAMSRILARVRLRADDLPLRRYRFRSARSSSFKATTCNFFLPRIYYMVCCKI